MKQKNQVNYEEDADPTTCIVMVVDDDEDDTSEGRFWDCTGCTYQNDAEFDPVKCGMCDIRRPQSRREK